MFQHGFFSFYHFEMILSTRTVSFFCYFFKLPTNSAKLFHWLVNFGNFSREVIYFIVSIKSRLHSSFPNQSRQTLLLFVK